MAVIKWLRRQRLQTTSKLMGVHVLSRTLLDCAVLADRLTLGMEPPPPSSYFCKHDSSKNSYYYSCDQCVTEPICCDLNEAISSDYSDGGT